MTLNYFKTLLCLACLLHTLQQKLIFAFAVARHGAEFPRNDLYDGNQTKNYRGFITPIGLRQHYNLGTYLRQNYGLQQDLISPNYNPKNVQFFSTTYERTLKSSYAFINGLYPFGSGWKIPEQVTTDKLIPPYKPLFPKQLQKNQLDQPFALSEGFTPVPVRSLDDVLDNCPNYNSLLARRKQQIFASIEMLQSEQRAQIARLKNIFNLTSSQENAAVMCDLYQTLQADQYLGRSLPIQYNQIDKKNLRYIFEYSNSLLFDGSFAKTLSTPLLRMIRSSLSKALQKTDLKFILTLSHKSNLYPLIVLLNLTSAECVTQKWKGQTVTSLNCLDPPQFAANLIFQLYEDDTFQHFVKIKYNGNYVNLCERKQSKCLSEEFTSRLKALQSNFQAQCGIMNNANIFQM